MRNIKIRLSLLHVILLLALLASPQRSSFSEKIKTIAITEIVAHPSLVQAKLGIIDELQAQGYAKEKNLNIIEDNAQGSVTNAALIAKKYISLNPDVIIAISTPSAQTVFKEAQKTQIPIVFSSVTDPVAAGIIKNLTTPNAVIVGAIDFPPVLEELQLIEAIVPSIKSLGILYNPGEVNSVRMVNLLKEQLENKWVVVEAAVTNSSLVTEGMRSLVGKVDAIYLPSDNTLFSAMTKVVQIAKEHNVPLFSSDPDSIKQGVLACYGYTQYDVGRVAGALAAKILNGAKMETLKISKPERHTIVVNKAKAKELGFEIPNQLLGQKITFIN